MLKVIPAMLSIFRKLMSDNDGATAIEYTLIVALISIGAIAAMGTVGGKVSNVLSNSANAMT
jgi:pilus assembly protein Flp/PilA